MKNYHRKTGRPTVLTPALIKKIVSFLRSGSYIETAVAACGISKETFYDWLKKAAKLEKEGAAGRKQLTAEEAMLIEFSDAIKKAMAMAEVHDLKLIQRAAKAGHWQAAAWRLERRYPQKWGRRIRAEISEPDDKSSEPEVDFGKLTNEQLEQYLSVLEILTSSEPMKNGTGQTDTPTSGNGR